MLKWLVVGSAWGFLLHWTKPAFVDKMSPFWRDSALEGIGVVGAAPLAVPIYRKLEGASEEARVIAAVLLSFGALGLGTLVARLLEALWPERKSPQG